MPAKRAILFGTSLLWLCCTTATGVTASDAKQSVHLGAGTSADDAVQHGILAGGRIPDSIHAVRERLLNEFGGVLRPHIVANGGHEHPTRRRVMYMVFESYEGPIPGRRVEPGELLLGFFLGPQGDTLSIRDGFVELIAWDRTRSCLSSGGKA
jgi:hypothetical protein